MTRLCVSKKTYWLSLRVCRTPVPLFRGGGRAQRVVCGGGAPAQCATGCAAQRVVRGGGGGGRAQRVVRLCAGGGGRAQRVVHGGVCATGCARGGGGGRAERGGRARRVVRLCAGGGGGVRNGLCMGGGVRNGLCMGGGRAERVVHGGGGAGVRNGLCAGGGRCAQRVVRGGKDKMSSAGVALMPLSHVRLKSRHAKKSRMSSKSSFRSPHPPQVFCTCFFGSMSVSCTPMLEREIVITSKPSELEGGSLRP